MKQYLRFIQKSQRLIILCTGTLSMLFLGLIYAWSIFSGILQAEFPSWSISQLTITFTISMINFCIFGFIAGKIVKNIKAHRIVLLSATMLLCGFFGVSFLSNKLQDGIILLYFSYGVLCAGGVGLGYNAILGFVNRFFEEKVGLSSGVLLMGFGLGGTILGSITNYFSGNFGVWWTLRFIGIISFSVMIFTSFIFKTLGVSAKQNNLLCGEKNINDKTTTEMVKSSLFLMFMLWCVIINSAGLMIINSAASMTMFWGIAGSFGLVVPLFSGVGRVILGAFYDKNGGKKALTLNTSIALSAGILMIFGAIQGNTVVLIIGMALAGVAYGGTPSISCGLILNSFGPKNYPANLSVSSFSLIPASLIGPTLSARLIENTGGEYISTYWAYIGFTFIAFLIIILFERNTKGQLARKREKNEVHTFKQ